jgi:diguanylate cyclase (GGDEF)-like protein
MRETQTRKGSERLILTIKGAYSAALLIVATMALLAYLLMQQMMATHQRDERLLGIVESQKTLSQRIVFLVNAMRAAPMADQATLLSSLKAATEQFQENYGQILSRLALERSDPDRDVSGTLASILWAPPHNLDYFTTRLAENALRFHMAVERRSLGIVADDDAGQRPAVDERIASSTLTGYTALGRKIAADSHSLVDRMLSVHRMLFFATILVICLVAVFIFRPMTEIIRRRTGELVDAHDSMAFIAIHDGLTGLHNRAFVRDQFNAVLKAAERRGERVAVIQIDLDKFKVINDTLGHAAGDFVLRTIAERLRNSCRASDICARLGGDEFLLIMPAAGSSQDIDGLARRILDKLNLPMDFEGATCAPGASAGIAVYPVDAETAEDLLVHSDLALYSAKKQGGGDFAFFSDQLRQELEHRKRLENDIRQAITDEAFTVYYQPQVSLDDGQVTGVEALVRWHHAERGMISPGEFIPVAERSGAMPEIGRLVMRKAIGDAAEWHRSGLRFGRLAINVSGIELREPDFARFLFATMEEAGLPPQKLSLEIVESVILDDEKTGIAHKLRLIRAAGVHLELDDFGTGYASLSHVNPKEIDRLKIDRRFVQNIDANDDNSKIVRAITELARGLGISIIAEGAETEAELSSLLSIGCHEVQGYSIAFPMPETQARDWIAQRSPRKPVLTLHQGRIA